jgi:hypothetical protein
MSNIVIIFTITPILYSSNATHYSIQHVKYLHYNIDTICKINLKNWICSDHVLRLARLAKWPYKNKRRTDWEVQKIDYTAIWWSNCDRKTHP